MIPFLSIMPVYSFYCPESHYHETKLMTYKEYELYNQGKLEQLIHLGSFECPDCHINLEKSLNDIDSVKKRVMGIEQDGRRPSGKMMKD